MKAVMFLLLVSVLSGYCLAVIPILAGDKPVKLALKRTAQLKAAAKSFRLDLLYHGDQDKPYYRLTLSVPVVPQLAIDPFHPIVQITEEEAVKVIGQLAVEGFLDQAKEKAPCIVFIDEIDAVGRARAAANSGGSHEERDQTLNQILVEMDGFQPSTGIVVIAATNRTDVLDPALTRPGRFDRRIVVDAPDMHGREAILKVHTKGKPLAENIDLNVLARHTPGFTGADLANLVNEAALLAARRSLSKIGGREMEDSVERLELYAQVQRIIARDVPYVSLWYKTNVAVAQRGLAGVRLTPLADFYFLKDVARVAVATN
jgi:hypothetical protein